MNNLVCVPEGRLDELKALMEGRQIPLKAVVNQKGVVAIEESAERKGGTQDVLYAGGWIACETARAMADSLEIQYGQMGVLLNHLDVKIRNCGLGCF